MPNGELLSTNPSRRIARALTLDHHVVGVQSLDSAMGLTNPDAGRGRHRQNMIATVVATRHHLETPLVKAIEARYRVPRCPSCPVSMSVIHPCLRCIHPVLPLLTNTLAAALLKLFWMRLCVDYPVLYFA